MFLPQVSGITRTLDPADGAVRDCAVCNGKLVLDSRPTLSTNSVIDCANFESNFGTYDGKSTGSTLPVFCTEVTFEIGAVYHRVGGE